VLGEPLFKIYPVHNSIAEPDRRADGMRQALAAPFGIAVEPRSSRPRGTPVRFLEPLFGVRTTPILVVTAFLIARSVQRNSTSAQNLLPPRAPSR